MREKKILKIKDALSKNMIDLRKKKRPTLSQAKLAEMIGMNVRTINEIESGKRWPDHTTIELIAKALDVEETDLFDNPTLVSTVSYLTNK